MQLLHIQPNLDRCAAILCENRPERRSSSMLSDAGTGKPWYPSFCRPPASRDDIWSRRPLITL
jgi:hypothetical protein